MKKLVSVALLLSSTILFSSCSRRSLELSGSGKIVNINSNFKGFTKVDLSGMIGEVNLTSGALEYDIEGEIDDNLFNLVDISKVGETLFIKLTGNERNALYVERNKCVLNITAPLLDQLKHEGNGSVRFALAPHQNVTLDKSGNAWMSISGTGANNLGIAISGNGDVDIQNLKSKNVTAIKFGNGVLRLNTDNPFKLNGEGNGDVTNTGYGVLAEGSSYGGNGDVKLRIN